MICRRKGRRSTNEDTAELNITAFLNLMVILVPFLLITAVFSRLAILEAVHELVGLRQQPLAVEKDRAAPEGRQLPGGRGTHREV